MGSPIATHTCRSQTLWVGHFFNQPSRSLCHLGNGFMEERLVLIPCGIRSLRTKGGGLRPRLPTLYLSHTGLVSVGLFWPVIPTGPLYLVPGSFRSAKAGRTLPAPGTPVFNTGGVSSVFTGAIPNPKHSRTPRVPPFLSGVFFVEVLIGGR